ncbi:PREDICTED: phosphatidylcholine:ceramide cholinephosphotransferase 1-like isoform X2 [Priapulus caudatus]|uniref:Phosphatidylcholine:ceramide cholinephosphotransferase 1-like isoform X2 n=1 Tax=Priapulus caudatus TaxID=37621 RepID=A0ABM1EYP6_PRICU|nr:PREDICTED: phosphatidylcholine:ceramide cholinephosphotransferase 1-like isoform X2 [Priapulus caudatus]
MLYINVACCSGRWIVMRRIAFIVAMLYAFRCITMFVTILPVPSEELKCSPKTGLSVNVVVRRAIKLLSGFGLSVTGVHNLCGDYIYSGHTFILIMTYMFIREYTPRSFVILHWLTWLMCCVGVFCVLASHEHYTVDVVLAYYISTRLFWCYHTLAASRELKKQTPSNYLTRNFWFPIFVWFERNVGGPLPKQYSWPFPCPKYVASWSTEYPA